jgi:hypothetical protein
MKKILRARTIMLVLAFLVFLSIGIGSNRTTVRSANAPRSPEINESAVWDVASTYEAGEPTYSEDGSTASYDVSSVSGTVNPVYFDPADVPYDIQDYANQVIADFNNGAITGVLTVDVGSAESSYDSYQSGSGEFEGNYDSEMYMSALTNSDSSFDATAHGPNAGSEVSLPAKGSGFKANFKLSGSAEPGKSLDKASMLFGGFEDKTGNESDKFKVATSKFTAPGFGFGGADAKVRDWGNTPQKSIKSTMKKHDLQVDIDSVQMDAATNTMSVRHRVSLKKKAK